MKRIVVATGNAHKVREIGEIVAETKFSVPMVSMKEAGIEADIVEDGETFEENALCKVRAVRRALDARGEGADTVVLADDSGLVIDVLGGEPGIHSARYLGEETPHAEKNKDILRRMKDVPEEKRAARFVCAVALSFPDGEEKTVRGVMEGRIAHETKGANGFGYDPVFFLPERNCTSAELAPEEKNRISHRGQAFREAVLLLQSQN